MALPAMYGVENMSTPPRLKELAEFRGRSTPNASRGFHDQAELGPLFDFGQHIPFHGRSKAALGAQREILQGNVLGGVLDPSHEYVSAFHSRQLGADQAENDGFSARHETQRFECTGALVVVFEQKTVNLQSPEQ